MPEEGTAEALAEEAVRMAGKEDAAEEMHARTGAEQGAQAPNLPESGPGQDLEIDSDGVVHNTKEEWIKTLAKELFSNLSPFLRDKNPDRTIPIIEKVLQAKLSVDVTVEEVEDVEN